MIDQPVINHINMRSSATPWTFFLLLRSTIQIATNPEIRARVMSVACIQIIMVSSSFIAVKKLEINYILAYVSILANKSVLNHKMGKIYVIG
jgi:hypothetical protein